MRLFSNPESSNNFEVSLLSIVESLASCMLACWVVIEFEIYIHFIIALFIAPFLLLRTNESVKEGVFLLERSSKSKFYTSDNIGKLLLEKIPNFISFCSDYLIHLSELVEFNTRISNPNITRFKVIYLFVLYVLPLLASVLLNFFGCILVFFLYLLYVLLFVAAKTILVATIIKIGTTVKHLIIHPINALISIPNNWFKIVFSTDSIHPPEIVPGIETYGCSLQISELIFNRFVKINYAPGMPFIGKISTPVVITILYLPTIFYRWMLKSSSIIYLPLIWICSYSRGFNLQDSQKQHSGTELLNLNLRIETEGVLAKAKLAFAVILCVFMILSLIFIEQYLRIVDGIQIGSIFNDLVNYWLLSTNKSLNIFNVNEYVYINFWHITRLIAAIITIYLFFHCERLLIKRRTLIDYGEANTYRVLFWLRFIRANCSIFTIACGIYLIIWPILKRIEWDNYILRWVPW